MNELQIFNFESHDVRTILKNGEPWFVAKDVAETLGYADTDQAIRQHCKASDSCPVEITGQTRHVKIIPERDVYRLIMRSKLPSAEKFEEWVVGEVLPSVRATGNYSIETPEMQLAKAVIVAQQVIERQTLLITEMQPKAEFFDAVTDSRDAVDIGQVAKVLNFKGMGRVNLFEFLRDSNIIMANNQPYQRHIDAGHFRVIEGHFNKPDGSKHVYFKTVVYQKGVDYIRKKMVEAGYIHNSLIKNAA